ncbi:MAG: hypothetical protein JSV80_12750 [Acidobacteriota bacterium]|nr:MAG: hypothetical protein JSV80_12750 [Acidobacteriota bacterium]
MRYAPTEGKNMTRLLLNASVSLIVLTNMPAAASELTLSVDVPSDLGRTTYLANQTFTAAGGSYALHFDGPAEGLDAALSIGALARREDGGILFTSDVPFDVAGQTFTPRDVVLFDGADYALYLSGDDLRLSGRARIDALSRTDNGALAISFEQPETVGGVTYTPADVARIDAGTLSLHFDAGANGIPVDANVVGYDETSSGERYFVFDAPVSIGASTFLPGQVVRFDGADYGVFFEDPDFPQAAAASALSLPGSPGETTGLLVSKQVAQLQLAWDPACSSESSDYGVFEGTIGDFASHLPVVCSTGGATQQVVDPGAGQRFYLVVANNAMFEGSHGTDSSGKQRAPSADPCRTQQNVRACP